LLLLLLLLLPLPLPPPPLVHNGRRSVTVPHRQ
jgi:hypothetical protein